MARPTDPVTGKKQPIVRWTLTDALRALTVLLLLAPIALILAATVSPYAILIVLLVFVLYQAARM